MESKEIILLVGMWGVGKSFYADKFIKDNPHFVIPSEPTIEEIKKHDFAINQEVESPKENRLILIASPKELRNI